MQKYFFSFILLFGFISSSFAGEYNLTIDKVKIDTGDFVKNGIGFNGASPGPTLRFKEGEDVVINVTNNLSEESSIHWHGLILPYQMDGVPTISYDGIKPGETFTYKFPIVQSGTYWFHSHSGFQEPDGAFGSIVIEPKEDENLDYDKEYVIVLSDTHPHSGHTIMRNLKIEADYYNRQQRTVSDFFNDVLTKGWSETLEDRTAWGDMRMMTADIEDVQGFTALMNGHGPEQNWTGLFKLGERVRLRFVNASAMTFFDIRIPGLKFEVVQNDGNNVEPVEVDEFRIAVAETYDIIVEPKEDKAYTIFAETMGRSTYARGTLAPKEGMVAEVPELREAPLLNLADMALAHNIVLEDGSTGCAPEHEAMGHCSNANNQDIVGKFYATGSGLEPSAANGGKFLSYNDLKATKPLYEVREPTREIEIRLTGNMERYSWSLNGTRYEDSDPIRLQYGERVRIKFINETMMTHPMHLHGMWSIVDNGSGELNPVKHVVSVAPSTVVYMETEVDAPGQWAFHCHLSYHAASGMFRKVIVEGAPDDTAQSYDPALAHLDHNQGGYDHAE